MSSTGPAQALDPPGALAAPGEGAPGAGQLPSQAAWLLLLATFVIATCGLIYELVAGAMASYLLGDSVTQFSLVIGTYLSAMGLGSWLSRWVGGDLLARFLRIEIAVGLLGGTSSVVLFAAHAFLGVARPALFLEVGLIGTLVGLEIPLLMRILRDQVAFAELVARVLAWDYLGALAASLLFPLVMVPLLGLPRTAFLFGLVNAGLALLLTFPLAGALGRRARWVRIEAALATAFLAVGLVQAERVAAWAEQHIYDAAVLLRERTRYQTIVVTAARSDLRLHLDGHLQFSSKDEYRYHEALVHPAAAAVSGPLRTALVLGGGDGMALRELLRYESLQRATLVDLDPAMTRLFADEPMLRALNGGSLRHPKVTVINADALAWLEEYAGDPFDLVVIDLPDPRNHAIGKLYTRDFYRLVRRNVAELGAVVVQSTSPWAAPRAFWCVELTLRDAGYTTWPYHCWVPSFGDWGYVLALPAARPRPARLKEGLGGLRFLSDAGLAGLFDFPPDQRPPEGIRVNRLHEQVLVHYHEEDWRAGGGE